MDIATMADVPAGTGLGSSGTFTVALLHALHLVKDEEPGPEQLAEEAAHIEIDLLARPSGKQDHYAAAYGGLNTIRFHADGMVKVKPLESSEVAVGQLFSCLMMVYTGHSRDSSTVLTEQKENIECHMDQLVEMRNDALELDSLLENRFDIGVFGEVMHRTWMKKRELATKITNEEIDGWYNKAIQAGAQGGKICGAGGGGFLLLVVGPDRREAVRKALNGLDELKIGYEPLGSRAMLP
jgi:D-glycero-alpha-D-manno-heptose-7-phosphate kinase